MELLHWVSAVGQFLLVFLGIIIALHNKWASKHRPIIILSFIFLGVIGIYAAIEQLARSASATADNLRLQRNNTELQQRLLSSNEELLARVNVIYESIFAAPQSVPAPNSPQALQVQLVVGEPLIEQNGVVNAASISTDAAVSPGSIAFLFGTNLSAGTEAASSTLPLPTNLASTQVLVNGVPAPLFFVSPLQINFQVPPGISGTTMQVVVVSNGVRGLPATVSIVPEDPGIFSIAASGTGQGAVQLENSDVIAAPTGSIQGRTTQPVKRGEIVSIFCTGLGAVDPAVEAGQPAPGSPLSVTEMTPVVLVGGVPGEVLSSGLAPGFVGLYRVNVRIPAAAPVGDAVELQIQIGGQISNTVTIAVD